jgi:hypothetical protein
VPVDPARSLLTCDEVSILSFTHGAPVRAVMSGRLTAVAPARRGPDRMAGKDMRTGRIDWQRADLSGTGHQPTLMPNRGRCLLGYLCTTQRTHSWFSRPRLASAAFRRGVCYALPGGARSTMRWPPMARSPCPGRAERPLLESPLGLLTLALALATAGTRGEPALTMILIEPEAVAAARTIQCPGCLSVRSCLWQRGAGAGRLKSSMERQAPPG